MCIVSARMCVGLEQEQVDQTLSQDASRSVYLFICINSQLHHTVWFYVHPKPIFTQD